MARQHTLKPDKPHKPLKWDNLKRSMGPDANARVRNRVQRTLAAMPLAEIRHAIGRTQVELAGTLHLAQGSVSKIERQGDMCLSTLRKYVRALGGELSLTAHFAGGRSVEIRDPVARRLRRA